jgi:hypothetical protein
VFIVEQFEESHNQSEKELEIDVQKEPIGYRL